MEREYGLYKSILDVTQEINVDIDKLIKSARAKFPYGHRLEMLDSHVKISRVADGEDEKTASVTWKIEYVPLEDFREEVLVDTNSVFTVDIENWEEDGWKCSATKIRMYSLTAEDKELLHDMGLMKTIERKSYETQLVCES